LLGWSTLAIASATFAIPFLGEATTLFDFVPLSVRELAAVVAIVGGYSRVFQASLWLKSAHSLLEVMGGLALAFVSRDLIIRMATAMPAPN